jgi:hypothetical protein
MQTVLVVVVNNRADWERVVEERWYRIPLKRAPQPVAADYLAFYLTSPFGDLRWQITYYAPVLRYDLLQRRELLPEQAMHPRADDLYLRVGLGLLQSLTHPVRSRRLRRIAFIPTTLERLTTASDVAQLWLPDDATPTIWNDFPHAAFKATKNLQLEETRSRYTIASRSANPMGG